MVQLADIFLASTKQQVLLQAIYRDPAITAYNRLEARPRAMNFERSIRAEVRDAMWMLTRQWQMGEFEADDAGSAIDARILTKQKPIDRISLYGATTEAFDHMIPMETFVEREKINYTLLLRIQMGQHFLKLHTSTLRNRYLVRYMEKFPIDDDTEMKERLRNKPESSQLHSATKRRAIDGAKIFDAIANGVFETMVPPDAGDEGPMITITANFVIWFERQYSHPQKGQSAWKANQLEYEFKAATSDGVGKGQVVLSANEYHQGRLDWYSMDIELRGSLPDRRERPEAEVQEVKPMSFIPTAAHFKGIPNPRFWEMEDRQIDFGSLNTKTTDHLMLMFAEYGMIYGNDWFVIPYTMPVNTLAIIEGLVITDVFGDRTIIKAADEGSDAAWQRWSMFNLSNAGHIGQYNRHFYLPATLVNSLESDPVEEVNFIRDEMSNLVWGIENTIPDETSKGINGLDAADKTGIKPPEITNPGAGIRYILGTTVPENWIPFIPVHLPGSIQEIYLQRATMPDLDDTSLSVVKPKGMLLNEVQPHYYLQEEQVPYSGTIVRRSYQRARWYNGKTYLWIGRQKESGRGQGSSGLRFDQIDSIGFPPK